MQYKSTKKPLREIARELNVDALIEGTVTRSGSHLRITANLVQASPEKHFWAESYESEVGDALGVQGKIAQAVARQIQVKLTQKEQTLLAPARPVNPEAQDLYLRGIYTFLAGGTAASSEKAINYFQRALEKDPNDAGALASLGQHLFEQEFYEESRDLLYRSLKGDQDQPAPGRRKVRMLLAIIQNYDRKYAEAEALLKGALRIKPSGDDEAKILFVLGRTYVSWGRREEAQKTMQAILRDHAGSSMAEKARETLLSLERKPQ